jgi:hypothetical protein
MTSSSRRYRIVVLAVGIALVSAGCLRIHVETQVNTAVAPATAFTGYYFCRNDHGLTEANFAISLGTTNQIIVRRFGPTTCVFSEPESYGARSVVLECVNPPAGVACAYYPTTQSLVVVATAGRNVLDVNIRITNDFT